MSLHWSSFLFSMSGSPSLYQEAEEKQLRSANNESPKPFASRYFLLTKR